MLVASALGSIMAALVVGGAADRLGRAWTYTLAQLLVAAGYAPVAFAAPLPVLAPSFFLVGFGSSFTLALGNVYCGAGAGSAAALGAMHASYGMGAVVGPLLAVAGMRPYYALLMVTLTLCGGALAVYAFRDYEAEAGAGPAVAVVGGTQGESQARVDLHGMFTASSTEVVVMGALFIFTYRAAEVTISNRAVSLFAGSSADSVFWAGVSFSRLLLTLAPARAPRIGERRLVCWLMVAAAASELGFWLAPAPVSNTSTFAIVGLLLGPVYPSATALFMGNMETHEQVSGIGVISAFGSSGAAAALFTAGVLTEVVGPVALLPITICLFAIMASCWYGMPRKLERIE